MILAPKRQYWSIEKDRPIELEVTVKNQAAEVEGVVVGRVDDTILWGHWIGRCTVLEQSAKFEKNNNGVFIFLKNSKTMFGFKLLHKSHTFSL